MVEPSGGPTGAPADAARMARAVGFIAAFARRQARRVTEVPGGIAVTDPTFALSYTHNKLVVTAAAEALEVLAAAERVLGGAGLAHRMVWVGSDPAGLAFAPVFVDAGYEHSPEVVMYHTGDPPDRPPDPSIRVEPVGAEALREFDREQWRLSLPEATDECVDQLVERRTRTALGADEVTFLAVREAGRVVARADLYLDRGSGTAQIEDVMTDPAHTNRGLARAIMADGCRRARAAGCDLIFLVADAEDWPRRLYRRLGYRTIGHSHEFVRAPRS